MPILNVAITTEPDPSVSAEIAERLTALTARHLGKDPAVTAVAVSHVGPQHWFAGGKAMADHGAATFWLDIKVVDGSNTKAEMADYIEAVFRSMGETLGPLHQESYVLVHEVPAAAYGFGGKTQEFRFISGRLAAA